jgi:hypothetical protein
MNMKNNPCVEELKELLKSFDDNECDHNLWVSQKGDVHISKIPMNLRADWRKSHKRIVKYYYDYFRGNGYVGESAANDDSHVTKLLSDLKKDWEHGSTGRIDLPGVD